MAGTKDGAEATPFVLKSAGQGFAGRSSDVFGGLDTLEKQHITHERSRTDLDEFADLQPDDMDSCETRNDDDMDVTEKRTGKTQKDKEADSFGETRDSYNEDMVRRGDRSEAGSGERPSRGRHVNFRRPSGRAPGRHPGRRNRVPDHGKGPQSWKLYSLEDIQSSDMSDKTNTQAALAFLDERRKAREEEERKEMGLEMEPTFDVGSAACSKGLFSFSKRSKADQTDTDSSMADKTKSVDSVVELPLSDEGVGTEDDGEGEQEAGVTDASSTKEGSAAKPAFKSRKGIKRNIRSRDDD